MYRRHPLLLLLSVGLFGLFLTVLLWIFNLSLLGYVITTQDLAANEKVSFVAGIYESLFTNFDTAQAVLLVVFATLFAINITMLIYVIKTKGKKLRAGQKSSSAASAFLAVIATGCAACGTSIITPLLLSLGASSTAALSSTIGIVVGYLSLLLVLYSIYSLGAAVANTLATED